MNLESWEINRLEACEAAFDWRWVVAEIKARRGGAYPPDWWAVMRQTGRMDRILAKWGEGAGVQVIIEKAGNE